MTGRPRVVFGMPAYNRPDTLARTLESLLSQTYEDFRILILDDAPGAAISAIVDRYTALDARITYEANPVRLGMIGNWRRAFARSRALFPESEYFAWASDHDIWHPRWLEVLVPTLDAHPEAVLAYPQAVRLYEHVRRRAVTATGTEGVTSPARRLRLATAMTAGNRVYGLFRSRTLAQAGVFRPVLMPDRQLLVELSLLGQFRQVPELLWYREVAGAFSYGRQRRMFFPGRSPLHTYLPAHVQHCGLLLWDLVVLGRGRPVVGRLGGMAYGFLQLWHSTYRSVVHRDSGRRRWLGRAPASTPSVATGRRDSVSIP